MMKKLLIFIFCVSLFAPLYAQDETREKKPFSFARQHFEIGINAGAGVANDILGIGDILTRNIVIDLTKIEEIVGDDGVNFSISGMADFFINIKNMRMFGGRWDIGFFASGSGHIDGNAPLSLFTLMSKGNMVQHSFSGTLSVSGGVFSEAGIKTLAKYRKLRIGVQPALYTPLIYIPRSGINYTLDTSDGVSLRSDGEIILYSPFIDSVNEGFGFGNLKYGFDISLEAEYSLFRFLDLGGSVSRIPIVPAVMHDRMRLSMSDVDYLVTGQELIEGNGFSMPKLDFSREFDYREQKILRPLSFDLYLRLKPFFGSEFLVLKPNFGFTKVLGQDDSYINMGAELRLNLIHLIVTYVSINKEEGIWTNRAGFALNLRAFEIGVEAALQSQTLKGSFNAQGLAFNAGVRFGW